MAEYGASNEARRAFLQQLCVVGAAAGGLSGCQSSPAMAPIVGGIPESPELTACPAPALTDPYREMNIRLASQISRLPWFAKDALGRVCLREDAGITPVIDMHVHLGWSHLGGESIDMARRSETQYFFEFERDQDLLFKQEHPTQLEGVRLTLESIQMLVATPERNKTHTAANLLDEMKRMGHCAAVLLPVEWPLASTNVTHTLAASALSDALIPFGGVHPWLWSMEKARTLDRQQRDWHISGIKYHPEFQFIAPDNADAMRMFEYCAEKGLVVYAHVGYTGSEPAAIRELAHPEKFIVPLEALPKLKMVFAHTGVRLIDPCLEVARRFEDQVWLDISGQPVPSIQYILQRYDQKKILYASDWPFYPLCVMLARTLVATEGCPQLRTDILHDNAARLLGWL